MNNDEFKKLIQARDNAITAMNHADQDYIDAAIYERKAYDIRIEAFLRHAREAEGIQTDSELLDRAQRLKVHMFKLGAMLP